MVTGYPGAGFGRARPNCPIGHLLAAWGFPWGPRVVAADPVRVGVGAPIPDCQGLSGGFMVPWVCG